MSSITENGAQVQASATAQNGNAPQPAFNRSTPKPETDTRLDLMFYRQTIADGGAGNERFLALGLISHPPTAKAVCSQFDKLRSTEFESAAYGVILGAAGEIIAEKKEPTRAAITEKLRSWTLEETGARQTSDLLAAIEFILSAPILGATTPEDVAKAKQYAKAIKDCWHKKNPPIDANEIKREAKAAAAPQPERPPAFEFGFTTDNDLDDRLGEIEWLWPGYIPRGFVTAAVGDQDVGKSQFAQSLCDIIIRGNRWPDGQPHEPPPDTKLLWIDTEGSIALLHQRMKQWGMKRGCFILPPDPLQELTVDDEMHWMWIEAAIEKFHPPIVVIDALSGAHKSGKENGNDEMKPVMKKLAGLAQKYNIAVLVVHHLNKPIAGAAAYPITIHRLRGASAIPQYCRSILALGTPDANQPEKRRMDVIKLNLAKKPAPVGYELSNQGPLWGDAPEPPKERRAIDDALDFLEIALKDGPRLSEDVQAEAKAQKIGSNALRDAMKAMKVKPRREGGKDGRWFWYPATEAHKDGQE